MLKGDSCNCATYDGAAVGVHNVLGVEMIRIIGLHSTLVLNMNATIVAKTTALVATLLYLFASVLYLLRFNIGAPVKVDFQYHHSWDQEKIVFLHNVHDISKASLNLWPIRFVFGVSFPMLIPTILVNVSLLYFMWSAFTCDTCLVFEDWGEIFAKCSMLNDPHNTNAPLAIYARTNCHWALMMEDLNSTGTWTMYVLLYSGIIGAMYYLIGTLKFDADIPRYYVKTKVYLPPRLYTSHEYLFYASSHRF